MGVTIDLNVHSTIINLCSVNGRFQAKHAKYRLLSVKLTVLQLNSFTENISFTVKLHSHWHRSATYTLAAHPV